MTENDELTSSELKTKLVEKCGVNVSNSTIRTLFFTITDDIASICRVIRGKLCVKHYEFGPTKFRPLD